MPDVSPFNQTDLTDFENDRNQQTPPTPNLAPIPQTPEVTKGQYGTVNPGEDINVDKTSYDYNLKLYNNITSKSQKENPSDWNRLPEIDVPNSETEKYLGLKYGFDISRNNESFYAARQGAPSMIANGVANAIVKTAAYAVQNLGLLIGAPDAATGGHLNMIDNPLTDAGKAMKDWIEKEAPIYKSDKYQTSGWGKLTTLGWWTDDAMDRLGLALSMAIPGEAEIKGSGIVSGLMKGGENLSKGAIWLNGIVGQSAMNAQETRDAILKSTGDKDKANDGATKSFWESLPLSMTDALLVIPSMFGRSAQYKSVLDSVYDKSTGEVLDNAFRAPTVGRTIKKALLTGLEHGQNESMQVAISRYNEDVATGKEKRGTIPGIFGDYLDNINDPNGQNNIALGTIQGIFMTAAGRIGNKITGKTAEEAAQKQSLYATIESAKLNRRYYNGDYAERNQDGSIATNPDGSIKTDQEKLANIAVSLADSENSLRNKVDAINNGDFLTSRFEDHRNLSGLAYNFMEVGGMNHLKTLLRNEAMANEKNPNRANDTDELGNEITPTVQLNEHLRMVDQLQKVYNSLNTHTRSDLSVLDFDKTNKDEVKRAINYVNNLKAAKFDEASRQLFLGKEITKNNSIIASLGVAGTEERIEDPSNPNEDRHNELIDTNDTLKDLLNTSRAAYKLLTDKDSIKEGFKRKDVEEVAQNFDEQATKKQEATAIPSKETPINEPAETPAPEVVTPEDQKISKQRQLLDQRNKDLEATTDPNERKAISDKYLKDTKDLKNQQTVQQEPITPESQVSKYNELKARIPEGKSIHVDALTDLTKDIYKASDNGEIAPEHLAFLESKLNDKDVVGTFLDKIQDTKVPEQNKDIEAQEDLPPTPEENPQIGQTSDIYNPYTENIDDSELENEVFSAVAFNTSNKTVTQEELETNNHPNGKLDEDEYKQFKQNFLRQIAQNPDLVDKYKYAKIIKDNDGLPHSEQTRKDIESGKPYGSVMVLTDSEGNIINFGPNYEESMEAKEGYKPLVYSFTRTYWNDSAANRAVIGNERTGRSVDDFLKQYAIEGQQQETARALNDQGKDVKVEINHINPGMIRKGKNLRDTSLVVTEEMRPSIYLPPGPVDRFDPANPNKNKFVIVGNQALINGGLYAHIVDPQTNLETYVRLIPKAIGEIPEMFEEVRSLLTAKYKDQGQAEQARDYLSKLLFLNRVNRPGISVNTDEETDERFLVISDNKVKKTPEEALRFAELSRFNVLKENMDNPDDYVSYKAENGKLTIVPKSDYHNFLLNNTQTRDLPIKTTDGLKYISLNTYAGFKFSSSLDSMKAELGKNDKFEAPVERTLKLNKEDVAVFRHGEAWDDAQGKTSGLNPTPLTREGKKLATLLGETMKNLGITKLIHSPVLRAEQTAEIAAEVAGIKDVTVNKDLRTWDIGDYAGGPRDDFDEQWFINNPDEVEHNGKKVGESFNTFVNRMLRVYKELQNSPEGTAIIAHSRNIRIWDAYKMNNEQWNAEALQKFLNLPSDHAFTSFSKSEREIKDNSSLTKTPFRKRGTVKTDTKDAAKDAEDKSKDIEKGLFSKNGQNRAPISESEISDVRRIFGDNDIQRINQVSNSGATAEFTLNGIKLYRDAVEGDGYHEAWHKFTQLYLNSDEKRSLYDELRTKGINFESRDGRKLNTKTASDFDIEEFAADDFRDYVTNDGKSRVVSRPYRNTIFRRIYDFIRKFFFGDVNVSKFYDDLYKGNLGSYNFSFNNAWWGKMNSQALNHKGDEIISDDKAAYYRGVVDYLLGNQLLNRKTSIDAMRRSQDLTQSLYEDVYNDLVTNYYNPLVDKAEAEQPHNEQVLDDLDKILSNWQDFVEYHKDSTKLFINIPHDIIQDVPSTPQDYTDSTDLGGENYEIEDDTDTAKDDTPEDEESLMPQWDRQGNEQNPWDSSSPETRALVRMLPEIKVKDGQFSLSIDSNGFPRLNDYSKTWNNMLIALGDIGSYDDMIEKMKDPEVLARIPELSELVKHLPDPSKEHSKDEMDQIIRFRTDFNKSYVGIYSGKMYPDGTYYFQEETKRNKDAVKKQWTANFYNKTSTDTDVQNGNIQLDEETGKYYLNQNKELTYNVQSPSQREALLNLLGIKFSDDVKKLQFYNKDLSQYLSSIQSNINGRLALGQRLYNPAYDINYDLKDANGKKLIDGLSGIMNGFLAIEAKYSSEVPSMSYQTAEGNMIYAMSENNSLTINRNNLNRATDYSDITNNPATQHFNFNNNPYVRHSLFLNLLFNLNTSDPEKFGRRTSNNLIVGNYNGLKSEDKDGNSVGYSTTSLNTRQKIVFDMNSMLTRGAAEIPRTETAKSAYFVKMQTYGVDRIDPSRSYLPVGISEFSSGFDSPKFKSILNDQLYDELNRIKTADDVPIFNKKGNESLLESNKGFHVFRNILENEIKDGLKEDIKTLSVEKALEKHGDKIDRSINDFFKREVDSFKDTLRQENVSMEMIAKDLVKFSSDQKIRAFIANDFVLKSEYVKLFDGDTAYQAHYKDYFKRSKGVSSTGKTPITDDSFARYMKSGEANTFSGFIGSKVNNDYKTTRTINLKDDKRSSKYIDIWKENLKQTDPKITDEEVNNILSKYQSMNIGDGQGHITLDFYRQFLRSIDNWSENQEKMYQVELAKWRLDNRDFNDNYSAQQQAYDRDFLRRNGDITFSYFPPVKMQYHGPIDAKGTYAQVMDKFSVAPLIPSIVKGTPLADLNHEMLKNGIGYSKFESGTKKYKDPAIEIYNEDGYKGIDLSKHEPAVHFLDYLKEQINTNPKVKQESIFGSQVRKLIEANIFSKGNADKVDLERHARYKAILDGMKDINKEGLYDDLGLKEKDGQIYINDMKKFVGTLQSQAELRELNNEVKSYIQFDKDTNKIKYPLETSLNKKSIQDIIMGLIDSRLRKQYVNGDMLIQVSSSGFQSNDFKYKNATEDEIKQYGTNGLRFYHIGADGKTRAAQVKVGLNGGFEKLLSKDHPDGSKIGTIDRLNGLLKDEGWMNENRKSVTMIGYRIPTQGHNSMEFMEVAEFLPAHFGSSVIVPAEIVAKSGSDFDIDKLNVFRPSFDKDGKFLEDKTQEGYSNKIIDLYREILEDPKNFKSLITPNDTNLIRPDIDEVSVALGKRTQKSVDKPEPYSGTQIFRYKTNLRKFESLLSASKLLGIFAVNNTFNQILQQEGITTNTAYGVTNGPVRQIKLFLMSKEEKAKVLKNGRIDLSDKYDVTGKLKQDSFSQFINATVDAPSDDFFGYGNITYENAGVLCYLINQGNPTDRAYWFLHQPSLMHYYSELRSKEPNEYKSNVQARVLSRFTDKAYFYQDEETGVMKLDKKAFNDDINKILNDPKIQDIFLDKKALKSQTKSLKEQAGKISNLDAYLDNPAAKKYNALTFAYFLSLKEQAGLFREFQSNLNFDTTKSRSPLSSFESWKAQDQIKANKLFSLDDVNKISKNSIISSFDNKLLIATIGTRLMPAGFSLKFLQAITPKVVKDTAYKSSEFKRKYINNIESQWMEYMVKSLGTVDGYSLQSYSRYLQEGKNNIARRFNDIVSKYPELKDNYSLVNKIRPNFPNRPEIKKSNLEIQRFFDNTTDDQNRYSSEFRKLINFDDARYSPEQQLEIKNFFKDVAILGFTQSGFSRSNISFQEIIPHEIFADMFKNSVTNYRNIIASDLAFNEKYIKEFQTQFKNNQSMSRQPWRGRDYYLAFPFTKLLEQKLGATNLIKTQVNTKALPAPYENVEPTPVDAPKQVMAAPEVKTKRQFWPGDEDGDKFDKARYKHALDRLDELSDVGYDFAFTDVPDGLTDEEYVDRFENGELEGVELTRKNFEHFLDLHDKYGNEILKDFDNPDDQGRIMDTLEKLKKMLDRVTDINNDEPTFKFDGTLKELYDKFRRNAIPDDVRDEVEGILSKYGLLEDENQLSLFDRNYTDNDMNGDPSPKGEISDDEAKEALDNCKG